jgi:hypothetical protein
MLRHCSIMYVQSLRAIYGLLAVGRVGNLLCGQATYIDGRKDARSGIPENVYWSTNCVAAIYAIFVHWLLPFS